MFYRNKKDQKYLNKILINHIKRSKPIKYVRISLNLFPLPVVTCIKIRTIHDYVNYVEDSMNSDNESEWFYIKGITKLSKDKTIKNKEYIFCDSKNNIIAISNDINESITGYTSIFIAPIGSSSFYLISVNDKLSIE